MTKAEIIAAIKEIDGYTAMEGKAVVDMAQMALLNKLLEQFQGTASIGDVGLQVGGVDVSDTNPIPANLVTALSSDYDTMNVNKMSKGAILQTTGIAATVALADCTERDFRNYSAANVQVEVTAGSGSTWSIALYGAHTSGGTFLPQYDENGTQKIMTGITTGQGWTWPVVGANYIKLVPTETVNGSTITITVTPIV